jgi:hypothetical protein
MNLSRATNLPLARRLRAGGVADQAEQQGRQVEAAIEGSMPFRVEPNNLIWRLPARTDGPAVA